MCSCSPHCCLKHRNSKCAEISPEVRELRKEIIEILFSFIVYLISYHTYYFCATQPSNLDITDMRTSALLINCLSPP